MIPDNLTAQHLQEEANLLAVKILLVDDRPENLISLESLLAHEGDNVSYLFAHSGEEALKIALQEELALILLDVQMPGMNGYEVARFLRNSSKTKDIPIIFVTAIDQSTSHVEEGFEAGAVDFLFKPLNSYITKAKVKAFLRFYRQKKALEKAHQFMQDANRKLEERVNERTEELMRINSDLDNFIYTASHDLKAPISNIEGLVKLLFKSLSEEAKSGERVISIEGMIHDSVARFKSALKDLTEVAKAQEDATDKDLVRFEELLEEVKSNIHQAIESSGAILKYDFSRAPEIVFSKKNLRSIMYNLVSNGIKYRSPERVPQLTIITQPAGEYTLLMVQDNGLGIKEKDKEKVFTIFKRLHTHVEGTGVGMAIVKRIIENSGGKIELESEVNKGSTFKIYLK